MVEILTILGVVARAMPLMSHLHMISVWVGGRSLITKVMMAIIIQLIKIGCSVLLRSNRLTFLRCRLILSIHQLISLSLLVLETLRLARPVGVHRGL